jgi:hypothetical protein
VRIGFPLLLLVLSGCGRSTSPDAPIGDPTPQELAEVIEKHAQGTKEDDPAAPVQRLGTLEIASLPEAYRTGRACRLTRENQLLLVAAAPGAVAKMDGKLLELKTAGPVGPSGGYFEAPGATVSIGLRAPAGAVAGSPSTRAGVAVGGGKERPMERLEASWTCSAA